MTDIAITETGPALALLLLQGGGAAPASNPLVPVVIMVVIFYLVLFLPMRRRQKKMEEMLKNLSNGDRVVTNGGLIGTITALTDKTVTLRIKPSDVKLEFARSSVQGVAEEEASEEEKK